MYYTVYLKCILCLKDKSSVRQKAAQEEDIREKLNGDLSELNPWPGWDIIC